jgi:competence protein ComEA
MGGDRGHGGVSAAGHRDPHRPTRTGRARDGGDARYTAAHAAASEAPLRSLPQEAEAEPVNLNTATQAELETLTGVGPVLAARIIDYRETHGPFARTEDITRVQGIAEKVFADNAGRMTVDGGGETE